MRHLKFWMLNQVPSAHFAHQNSKAKRRGLSGDLCLHITSASSSTRLWSEKESEKCMHARNQIIPDRACMIAHYYSSSSVLLLQGSIDRHRDKGRRAKGIKEQEVPTDGTRPRFCIGGYCSSNRCSSSWEDFVRGRRGHGRTAAPVAMAFCHTTITRQ